MAQPKRLGELLIEASLITQDQLAGALRIQQDTRQMLGQILIDKGWVSEEKICQILSKKLHVPYTHLHNVLISQDVVRLVPEELAVKYQVLPVLIQNTALYVAMADPRNIEAIQQIEFKTGMSVKPLLAAQSQIREAIRKHYTITEYVGQMLDQGHEDDHMIMKPTGAPARENADAGSNEIIRLANSIVAEGIKLRASDIHIDLLAQHVSVQYRIDGILTRGIKLPKQIYPLLLNRFKVLAGLNITAQRASQDGHIHVTYQQRELDLRVSTVMSPTGEKIVMRVLDRKTKFDDITRLGLSPQHQTQCRGFLQQHQGLILTAGPTGSGKTTTLYALLNALKDGTKHIVTIEDPIEYQLDGVTQIQINARAGATFASGLRSVLRHNPNVILIGEIRDAETAAVAMQASEAGHLVLSTIHANDTIAAVSRLLALNISTDLIASNLLLIIAQRLIRRICPRCQKEYHPEAEELQRIGLADKLSDVRFYKADGCNVCRDSGYYGQIGIFELFAPDPHIRQAIARGTGTYELRRMAREAGMPALCASGVEAIRQGVTTLEEVLRACPLTQESFTPTPPRVQPDQLPKPAEVPEEARAEPLAAQGQPETSEADVLLLEEEIVEQQPRIVIAEDDPTVSTMLRTLLERKGYQALLSGDGEEALQKIQIARPDLVLLDINMPKKDGFAVCEALRANVNTAFIPVIMLTAQSSIESKLRGLAVGADDYMTKPFHPQELLARVEAILRRVS